ncbi:uncharacterized protein LOC110709097 [Chenopodium quinoa]|uniref:uncharacterized protein LOC110709097 n=1 Tax=Chenopodium quinoa TaxID=63459 RepID=UPI000B797FBE|nr:uncharacterized protein LOC110709097 [Chenopodium quinoa]
MWYLDPSFTSLIHQSWPTNQTPLSSKLQLLSHSIQNWEKTQFPNPLKKIQVLSKRIVGIQRALESDPSNGFLQKLDENLSIEIYELYAQEESFWAVRARTNWATSGDRNTSFFHTSVIIRMRRNRIDNMRNEVGEQILPHQLHDHINSYFFNLFSTETSSSDYPSCTYGNEVQISHLPLLFETHSTVFNMGRLKALEIDGFHPLFFQNH